MQFFPIVHSMPLTETSNLPLIHGSSGQTLEFVYGFMPNW